MFQQNNPKYLERIEYFSGREFAVFLLLNVVFLPSGISICLPVCFQLCVNCLFSFCFYFSHKLGPLNNNYFRRNLLPILKHEEAIS